MPSNYYVVLGVERKADLSQIKRAYRDAINARDPGAEVSEHACEMLVALAEEGWDDGAIARAIAQRYLDEAGCSEPDTIILGCTHFPILRRTIQEVAAEGVVLVDSASTTAEVVRQTLRESDLLRATGDRGALRFLATDGATRFARVGGRFLGRPLGWADVEVVDL